MAQGFREFQTQLTTPKRESTAAQSHRASIEACLKEQFGLEGFFQTGSYGNGTNIPVHSDVDRFAAIPRENLPENSRLALRAVYLVLKRRFRTTARIRISPPAVIVPFGVDGLETTEVIPVNFVTNHAGHKVYRIPNPSGGINWILSSPQALRNHINEIDDIHDNRLKPLIRFLKAWKYHRKAPIHSVYLDLTCAAMAHHIGLSTPSIDIARVLHFMRSMRLTDIHDPLGISNPIQGPRTARLRSEALGKVTGSAKLATLAVTAEIEWRLDPAFKLWGRFFGPRFPNPK